MELTQLKAAATALVSTAQVKSVLRLTTNEDDDLLATICATATDLVQRCVGRSFLTQTWSVCHRNNRFILPMWPVAKVVSVRRRNKPLTLAQHDGPLKDHEYRLSPEPSQQGPQLCPTVLETVFAYSSPKLTVTYEAGFGQNPEDVPEHYKFSVLRGAVWLYRNITQEIPWTPEAFSLHCLGESQVPGAHIGAQHSGVGSPEPFAPAVSVVRPKKSSFQED